MGLVPGGALATKMMTFPSLSWPVPANWSLEQAVTMPAAYVLVRYVKLVCYEVFLLMFCFLNNLANSQST